MQLLEQLNLADSLATTQDLHRGQHNTSSLLTLNQKRNRAFLSDLSQQTLKMGAASLPPNLFLISSKPKFLSKMFLLFYFSVSSLNLRSRQGSKLLTLTCRNKSRSKLKLYYCTWGVGNLVYYVKFYLLILWEIDYYKRSFSNLIPLSANNSSSKLVQHSWQSAAWASF